MALALGVTGGVGSGVVTGVGQAVLLVMVVASVPWALVVVQVPLVLCAVSDVGVLAVLERQFSE